MWLVSRGMSLGELLDLPLSAVAILARTAMRAEARDRLRRMAEIRTAVWADADEWRRITNGEPDGSDPRRKQVIDDIARRLQDAESEERSGGDT